MGRYDCVYGIQEAEVYEGERWNIFIMEKKLLKYIGVVVSFATVDKIF